jgi:RNA polymerase sigma factor (sigma-70 family)
LLQSNDEAAFEAIYYRCWQKLFNYAVAKLNNLQVAEEIIHDVFVDIWNRRHDLSINGPLENYLAAAVKYRVVNERVKQQKLNLRQRLITDADEESFNSLPYTDIELRNYLDRLIQTLPEKTGVVFRLGKLEGFRQKEIARSLNMSEKNVEYHLSSAMKKLQTRLTNLFILLF